MPRYTTLLIKDKAGYPALIQYICSTSWICSVPELLPLADRRCPVGKHVLIHDRAVDIRQRTPYLDVGGMHRADNLSDARAGLLRQAEVIEQGACADDKEKADGPIPDLLHLLLPSADTLNQSGEIVLGCELDLDLVLSTYSFHTNISLKYTSKLSCSAFE